MADLIIHAEMNRRAEIVTTLIGEVDAHTVSHLGATLESQPLRTDVVDCRFVPFMSVAGLDALATAHESHPFRTIGSTATRRVAALGGLLEALQFEDARGQPWLRHAPFGVGVHDADLRYLYVNDWLAGLHGLPAHEHHGHRPSDLFDIDEDDLSPILRTVHGTRSSHTARVLAVTDTNPATMLRCQIRHVRYNQSHRSVSAVVATVHPIASSEESTHSPTHVFKYSCRPSRRRHRPIA